MLTVKFLDSKLNKKQDKEIVKAHRYGLYARIRKTGKVSFIFRYKWLGKQERVTIGGYPELTITQASDIAKSYQAMIADNKNPKREKMAEKIRQDEEYTVKELLDEWWDHHFQDHPKRDIDNEYPYNVKKSFQIHVYPKVGKLPWEVVDRQAWSKLFTNIKSTAPSICQRVVTCIKSACTYGIGHGIVKTHPLMEFSAKKTLGITSKRRVRNLDDIEIYRIFEALDESRTKPGNKILFKLLMIYGCRTIELRLLEPAHLDFKNGVWTVPKEIAKPKDMKNVEANREIIRPLFDETIELFKLAMKIHPGSKYVFPKESGEPMSQSALLDIPERLNTKIHRKYQDYRIEHWGKHDLRRTVRTRMSKITQYNVAEKMLGHVLPGEGETYDQYDYLEEQLMAYQKWYQVLDNIWNQRDNVTVIGMKKGA